MDATKEKTGNDMAPVVAVLAGLGIAGAVTYVALPSAYPLSRLIDHEAVAYIADQLPQDEDAFILSAWDLVGEEVKYAPYSSIMQFENDSVMCRRCVMPAELIRMSRPKGNCIAKSALLASILGNRLGTDRVYMTLGQLQLDGLGGHGWVIVERGGAWNILEATMPPSDYPWLPMQATRRYIPDGFVNDDGIVCLQEGLCTIDTGHKSCLCELEKHGSHASRCISHNERDIDSLQV